MAQKPDQGQGLLDEIKSQGTGLAVGVATAAVAVPFLGWVVGVAVGGAAIGVTSYRRWSQKRSKR